MKQLRSLIIVTALGYFVDIYDLILFSIVRVQSLTSLGVAADQLMNVGVYLINAQMIGMLIGGVIWGIMGDKRGRLTVLFGSILVYSLANIANAYVQDIQTYAIIRFIAGVGLAGELGAGITLVTESMSKEKRGYGTMIVASIGLMGAVFAAFITDHFEWRTAYLIGGVLGFLLLLMRVSVTESSMFTSAKKEAHQLADFKLLFNNKTRFLNYLNCILIGLPVWFVVGILITFSPEIAKEIGITEPISVGKGILYCYLGTAIGDIASGVLSQMLKSRKKVVFLFLIMILLSSTWFLYSGLSNAAALYQIAFVLGFSAGYWALFVTIASEQFGTNIRSTVTTTVPNFVRAAVVPLTLGFAFAKQTMGAINAAYLVGLISIGIALFAIFQIKETFGKDLDYIEK
jgi:predicted MFS family arabinose efflux permease